VHVVFHRLEGHRYCSHVHRDDGVVVRVPGWDRKWRIPHDVAHLVTERELRLPDGIYGSIASGALFTGMEVVSGRPRHDARAVSERVLRANGASGALGLAELLGGSIHLAAEGGDHAGALATVRYAWELHGGAGPCPYDTGDVARVAAAMQEVGEEWVRVRPGQHLELAWPLGVTRHRGGRPGARGGRRAEPAAGRRPAHAARRG
jgi:hypothetical protein